MSPFTLGSVAKLALSRPPLRALPTLILDLDETILHRPNGWLDKLALYSPVPLYAVGVPYTGALSSLHTLGSSFNLVAVTARQALAERNTAQWLAAQGLGELPVLYASSVHSGDGTRGAFKASAIRHVRAAGWQPVAGVGDRPSDMEAYAAEGLLALMVTHAEGATAAATERHATALRQAQLQLPLARVAHFSDCPRSCAILGLQAPVQGPAVWQQVSEHLLSSRSQLLQPSP